MPIVVDIDVMLARRKMAVGALADQVGITPANLAVLKNGRAKAVRFSTLEALCEALEATWRRDTTLYYEDGFQAYADGGAEVRAAPIGAVAWVEVDDHADLARAREIAGGFQPEAG